MTKAVIIYHSEHHGNTKKLAEAIASAHAVDLVEAEKAAAMDLSGYDTIGFASGIYMAGFHPSLMALLSSPPLRGKKVFVLCTSGSGNEKYPAAFANKLKTAGFVLLGAYHCRGLDTNGPFRLVGGISKGHPTTEEVEGAVRFYERQVMPSLEQSCIQTGA